MDIISAPARALLRLWLSLLLALACCTTASTAEPQSAHSADGPAEKSSPQSPDAGLPLTFQRHTGDLDEMVKRGSIRALVLYSRSSFFYVDGRPQGTQL